VLTDNGYFGQNLLARLDHDLLSLPGVTHTILLEGINDLNGGRRVGNLPTAASLIQAYQQFITRAHIRGIAVIGGTITPTAVPAGVNYTTNAFAPSSNAIRLELNDWIRNSGAFDYVVDFDRAVRNASYPDQMQNQYASSDWLHPNNVGYQAMADTFDLSVFGRLKGNVDNYA
jgi:lysophospholipase L1-like esterase